MKLKFLNKQKMHQKVNVVLFNNNEKGSMTVEASIALTAMIFFVLFIMDFGMIYRAQNYMTHSIYQTAKCVSFSSHRYSLQENDTNLVDEFMNYFKFIDEDNLVRLLWRSEDYEGAVKEVFYKGITDTENLKKYGIENVQFDINLLWKNTYQKDMKMKVTYNVVLPFKLFGLDKAVLHQEVLTGLWQKENMDIL